MYLLELSQQVLKEIINLNDGIRVNENIFIKNGVNLRTDQLPNLEKLKETFKGNVQIVIHDDPARQPCTFPGLDSIISPGISPVNIFKICWNFINNIDLKVNKIGEVFNITSDTKVIIYLPRWFLSNYVSTGNSGIFTLTDEQRIATILHELGHWESLNTGLNILIQLTKFLGIILFFYGISNLFKKKDKSKIIEAEEKVNEVHLIDNSILKNAIYIISGLFFYIVVSKLISSESEIISDNFVNKYGYGDKLAEFVKNREPSKVDISKTFNSLFSIIEETMERIKTGYPSVNWRAQNLLNNNITENIEYLTEFNFSMFINPFENFLNRLNTFIPKLIPLKNIGRIANIKPKRSINEDINILIYQSYE